MKTIKSFLLSFLFITIVQTAFAQSKEEAIKVAGECGMCKTKIEKAALSAGADFAEWDVDKKILSVKYSSTTTNTAKIEQAVAASGYDTQTVKAKDEDYNKLHGCCKYERTAASKTVAACCNDAKCGQHACMKDGKCTKDMSCCKDAGCVKKDCCKKA